MFGGNNLNSAPLVDLDENCYLYQTNVSNQLQLFGTGCSVDPINYSRNKNVVPMPRSNKRGRETEDISIRQKLQISLKYKDEVDRLVTIPNPNAVSTGLRLSYDDDEHNSSVTSASGSLTTPPSMMFSLSDNIRTELDRQKEEFEQYIKIQKENLAKGVRDIKQKHMASLFVSLEKGISKKLHEKDLEIDNVNQRNRELIENIKQVAMEAQSWHHKAKYNESVVYALKSNLQRAISQGADHGKEGFGDSEVDDASSYIEPNKRCAHPGPGTSISRNLGGLKGHMTCRSCRRKEVDILLMPCRHLCLCKDCDVFISACPVCQMMKTACVQVFLS